MKQTQIEQKIINFIGEIEDVDIINASDFSDQRSAFMVVVGITTTQQIYPHLLDFKYSLSIVIDCRIEDDPNGNKLNEINNQIMDKFYPYILKQKELTQIFGQIPVVGFIFNSKEKSISDSSNRIELNIDLYSSFCEIINN